MLNKILAKLNLKNLHKIKSFSILIIPTGGGIESKTHHLSSGKAYTFVTLYTLVVFILGFLIMSITPVKRLIFPVNSDLSPTEKKLVDELNQKMMYLSNELQNLRLTNEQLRNAIMLGDSALIDSITNKNRINVKRNKNPYGGDILFVIQKLFGQQQASSEKLFYFTRPISGFISRGFNPDIGHMGIDFVAKTGTPVVAAASGYVVFSDYTVKDGYMMIIVHSNGYVSVYKHCSVLLKKVRDMVNEGEVIALSGNSGEITTGPHLHFELWKDGKPIDPKNLFLTN